MLKKVIVDFECEECGNTFSKTFENYFEDENDLELCIEMGGFPSCEECDSEQIKCIGYKIVEY